MEKTSTRQQQLASPTMSDGKNPSNPAIKTNPGQGGPRLITGQTGKQKKGKGKPGKAPGKKGKKESRPVPAETSPPKDPQASEDRRAVGELSSKISDLDIEYFKHRIPDSDLK